MSLVESDQSANRDFDGLPFTRMSDAAFACHLPNEAHDKPLIELKPLSGQTPADMIHWLMNASIASASLLPLIQKRRLPGAPRRLLTATEMLDRKFSLQSRIFELQNQTLVIDGEDMQPIFQSNQALLIQGITDLHAPAAIILHLP